MRIGIISVFLTSIVFACAADSEEQFFKWGFEDGKNFVYDMEQNGVITSLTSKDGSLYEGESDIQSSLRFESITDTSANMIMTIKEFIADGSEMNLPVNQFPAQELNDQGVFKNEGVDIVMNLLLRLPKKVLSQGDTDTLWFDIPCMVEDTVFYGYLSNVVMFDSVEEINGDKCAVLSSTIKVISPRLPSDFNGVLTCSGEGLGEYYFSLDNGCFNSADVTFNMKMVMDINGAESNFVEQDIFMDMQMDQHYNLSLTEIEQ